MILIRIISGKIPPLGDDMESDCYLWHPLWSLLATSFMLFWLNGSCHFSWNTSTTACSSAWSLAKLHPTSPKWQSWSNDKHQQTKVPSVTGHHPLFICIIMQNIDGVNQVVHLSVVSANGSNSNTKSTFIALSKIWKCNYLDTNIKLGLCSKSSSIHVYVGLSGYSGLRQ